LPPWLAPVMTKRSCRRVQVVPVTCCPLEGQGDIPQAVQVCRSLPGGAAWEADGHPLIGSADRAAWPAQVKAQFRTQHRKETHDMLRRLREALETGLTPRSAGRDRLSATPSLS